MILRQFRDEGIQVFRSFLASCRINPSVAVPRELLEDDSLTTVVVPEIEVESRAFETKADAAEYFASVLKQLSNDDIANNAGLWTWLTLFYFEQVCPLRDGSRRVKNDYHYIFEPRNPRHFYRHLLFIAWRVLNVAPHHNRLMLNGSVATLDKVTTEIMKRLYLTRIPCIFEVLDRLYWDEDRGRVSLLAERLGPLIVSGGNLGSRRHGHQRQGHRKHRQFFHGPKASRGNCSGY
mgnify:CR=1 FL=1